MKTKIKKGDQFYFDILGRTNKSKTYTVTILKTYKYRKKVIVMSDQTNEVFKCKSKYLTPINSDNHPPLYIRECNSLIKIDEIDYKTIKSFKLILDQILEKEKDDSLYNFISKINEGLTLVLCKMATIIKNNQEYEIIENLSTIKINQDINIMEKLENKDESFSKTLDGFDNYLKEISSEDKIHELMDNFYQSMINYHIDEGIEISEESIDKYVLDNYPPELMLLPLGTYSEVDELVIEKNAKKLYKRMSDSCSKAFTPYLDIDGSNKSVKIKTIHFNLDDSVEDIIDKMKSIFIEKYKGKVPFRLCDILYGEEDDEMDEE